MNGRVVFKFFKPFFRFSLLFLYMMPRFVIEGLWSFSSLLPNFIGVPLRYLILKRLCHRVGDNVYVARNVVFKNFSKITIGSNVSFHEYCYFDGVGGIDIGNEVSIAHGSSVISFEHSWDDIEVPIKYNPIIHSAIRISDDVWIGCGVRILSGAEIGKRSIIAAGSVVTKNVPSNVIAAGVPAKPIKKI